jgi:hypothetical protein
MKLIYHVLPNHNQGVAGLVGEEVGKLVGALSGT